MTTNTTATSTNSVIKQKDAVYQAVTAVLSENGVSFEDGQNAKDVLTAEMRKEVTAILFQAFMNGQVELNEAKRGDESYIKSYIPGLITNHLGKDSRLNGNTKYQAKNPGSRFGAGDDQLKALKGLRTQLVNSGADADEIAEVEGHIATRTAQLQAAKPAKVKTVKVNFEDLPADLQAKYQQA